MDANLREYLKANMFDGDEGGSLTMPIPVLLDEIVTCVALFLIEASGAAEAVERYYLGDD